MSTNLDKKVQLEYLNTIDVPPQSPAQLHKQASQNDDPTIDSWREIWIKNQKINHEKFGPFGEKGIGKLFNEFNLKPCIIAGSGPSLANNIEDLKKKGNIPLISCLHNFHYFEDREIEVNYYVSLDAGPVTIEEISEGGSQPHEFYLERTREKTLLAFVGSDPGLISSWRGKVLWFNCPIPDQRVRDAHNSVERFENFISNGGNVLGACLYIAKAYMGANPIVYIGADFSFSGASHSLQSGIGMNKFHAWDSKYDGKLGQAMRTIDAFGNKVYTWASYYNFKCWHDSIAMRCPGEFINCSEGGTYGVYPEGLIRQIKHKSLKEFIDGYNLYQCMRHQAEHPENASEDVGHGLPPQPKLFF